MTTDIPPKSIKAYIDRITRREAEDRIHSMHSVEGIQNPRIELAKTGMNKLGASIMPSLEEIASIEAIILPDERPAIDITNDTFPSPQAPWNHFDQEAIRRNLHAAIPSVGRINIPELINYPYAGTGFVVGENLLMTNRHVAAYFSQGVGSLSLQLNTSANVNFKHELNDIGSEYLEVVQVTMIHPYWDMALIEVAGLSDQHLPLELSTEPVENFIDTDVAVIGYPALDYRNSIAMQNRLFREKFQIKRLQPGKLWQRKDYESYGKLVNSITHDSSTLGGNSGSAVVGAETGDVLALHFAGVPLQSNYAVAAYDLARDQRVVDAGVKFTGTAPISAQWDDAWSGVERLHNRKVYTPAPVNHTVDHAEQDSQLDTQSNTHPESGQLTMTNFGNSIQLTIPISTTPINITISTGTTCTHNVTNNQPSSQYTLLSTSEEYSDGGSETPSIGPIKPDPNYNRRTGYDPAFLSQTNLVPVPWLTIDQYADVAFNREAITERHLLKYEHFSICMKRSRHQAYFTACMVDGAQKLSVGDPTARWWTDPRIDETEQYLNKVYENNPLDRGHLVRRISPVWGETIEEAKKSHDDTFHWTNSAPQHWKLNRGAKTWRAVEDHILNHATNTQSKIIVFTGPVFQDDDPIVHLNSGDGPVVQIPLQFWKVAAFINQHGNLSSTSFLLSQTDLIMHWLDSLELPASSKVDPFQVPLTRIEQLTRLSFRGLAEHDTLSSQETLASEKLISDVTDIVF